MDRVLFLCTFAINERTVLLKYKYTDTDNLLHLQEITLQEQSACKIWGSDLEAL